MVALTYYFFSNLTGSYQIPSIRRAGDLARRPELPDEQVVWSHPVIHLPSMRPQCTQHLTFTCALLDRRLFHPHRLRSTVTGPYESGQSVRIAMRARPHETHPTCIYFSDLYRISQDHPPEDQVSPTIDYLLDQGLRGDMRAQVLRHKIKVCLDHLK